VTLAPGQTQTIRISARKPAELAEGEYRSHLQFDRIATNDVEEQEDLPSSAAAGQVAVALQTLVGASIPVIVRHGKTDSSVTLESLRLRGSEEPARTTLQFVLRRQGNQSVYGDLIAWLQRPGRPAVEVGRMNGVAVYVPNTSRQVTLGTTLAADLPASSGVVRVQFRERPEVGGRVLAEAELNLR
jgi:hypothetical protein